MLPSRGRRGRTGALLSWRTAALLASAAPSWAVLRYPDGSFESRVPLHVDECGAAPLDSSQESLDCLLQLRRNLLEDADCNRVICDNIATSTPVEVYSNQTDWAPFKNLCGNMQELFLGLFDLGVGLLGRSAAERDRARLAELWDVFLGSWRHWGGLPDGLEDPAYANSTRAVLRHHAAEALALARSERGSVVTADALLDTAVAAARRLQLLIENFSVTLLLNFHLAQLEHNGRVEHKRNLVQELYGDVSTISVTFHEIPGKRWDGLRHLLESLGISERSVSMAEVGVEAANTSQRLLERNPTLTYLGVDPYQGNEGLYQDVVRRLEVYREEGRFTLLRTTSLAAAKLVEPGSLDLVFLDARHDYEAVEADVAAWKPKVRPGGILSGHDFSWMFPTVAMAVYRACFDSPERTIHLAPDGVWWFQL